MKFLESVSSGDFAKIKEMRIPNSDNETDEKLWIENARKRIDKDLMMLDDAIQVSYSEYSILDNICYWYIEMVTEPTFEELIAKFKAQERPESFREYSEILENDKILDKWDFKTVYRHLSEDQKYNGVLNVFRALIKSGKGVKEILRILEKAE